MKASIIIATYNRENDLVRSIKSVLFQTYKNFELIIVDQTKEHNKTTQKFLESIKDSRYRYFLVSPPSLTSARNFGISKANGEIVIFIDDDVKLDSNFIKEHVMAYTDKKVGGVAGRVKVPGTPMSKNLYHITPTGWNLGGFDYRHDAVARSGARGCNMSFRQSVLNELGGFDTGYIKNAHREDSDISYRVMTAGYRIVYKASASLTHYHTPTGGSRVTSGLFGDVTSFANDFRFFYKNMNHSKRLLLGFYLMHLVYVVPHPNPKIALKRLYCLMVGSRTARRELHDKKLLLLAKELV